MYPNPQEALPLTQRPNLEHYRKLAKDLVKACRSNEAESVRAWALRWIDRLAESQHRPKTLRTMEETDATARRVEEFARRQFSGGKCSLTTAQFVVARAHGFTSWPKFASHLKSLQDRTSTVAAFEAGASAVVSGDTETLRRLLLAHPRLVNARSTREHGATLLHYVSANGVEGYRQLSPKNSRRITEMLIAAGADVNATTEVYQGKCTALGLVATSSPPSAAGVQREVIDVLLKHGARMDLRGSVGHDALLVQGCLANGQPEAAEYLANRGAPLDLESAAGLGRLDEVERLLPHAPRQAVAAAFSLACAYGRAPVIDSFVAHGGISVDTELTGHGAGHTGLHVAAFHGRLEAVRVLLKHGADIRAIDKTWNTPPLQWALTGWQVSGHRGQYYEVVAQLVADGALVTTDIIEWEKAQLDPDMLAALRTRPRSA
jgi:ankyrin repeat protein